MQLELNNTKQRQIIDRIMCGGYFLGTYHNPAHKVGIVVESDLEFENLLLTRLEVVNPKYADSLVITPMQGYYLGIAEPSFMLSFSATFKTANYLQLFDIMTSVFNDLGQASFIFRHTNATHCLINAQTGKADAVGQTIEFRESALCYSIINNIAFTMELVNADK